MIGDPWGWNWWEIVDYFRAGSACWEWRCGPSSPPGGPVLPRVLPIIGCGNDSHWRR